MFRLAGATHVVGSPEPCIDDQPLKTWSFPLAILMASVYINYWVILDKMKDLGKIEPFSTYLGAKYDM